MTVKQLLARLSALSMKAKIWIAVVVVFGGGLIYGQLTSVPVSGVVRAFRPVDVANLDVTVEFINEGDRAAVISCRVQAFDSSSRSVGFDRFETPDKVPDGDSIELRGSMRIEDEGAFRVTDVEAEDCQSE